MSEDEKATHLGYAGGADALSVSVLEAAIRRLLGEVVREEEPQKDRTVLVRTLHETDPPETFEERRTIKRPGPLPALLSPEEIKTGARVFEHEHEELEANEDEDVRAYHHARWAVLEARRLQAKAIVVRSVEESEDGLCVIRVAFVR